jgi:hypothetical protein
MAFRNAFVAALLLSSTTLAPVPAALAAGGGSMVTADPSKHFDPKGQEPAERPESDTPL